LTAQEFSRNSCMAIVDNHTHTHIHLHVDFGQALEKIDYLIKITEKMAKTTDELKAAVAEQAAIISNIAGDLDRIADKLENDPTEEEISAVVAEIRTNNEQLRAISNRNLITEPSTPEPTPEA
jgi:uncharacterized coiled-coil protein SlyX